MFSKSLAIISVALATLMAAACTTAENTTPTTTTTATGPNTSTTAESDVEPATTTTTVQTTTQLSSVDVAEQAAPWDGLSFAEFLEASYTTLLIRNPEYLTSLGIAADYGLRNDQLNDLSIEYISETQALERAVLERLNTYDRAELDPIEQTSYDAYLWYLDNQVQGHPFTFHSYPVHHFLGSYNDNLLRVFTDEHPLDTLRDAEDYVTRLSQIGRQVDDMIARLEISESMGIVQPTFVIDFTVSRLRNELRGADAGMVPPQRMPLYSYFEDRLDDLPDLTAEQKTGLLSEAAHYVEESFLPAWIRLVDHLVEVRPLSTDDPGLWRLPDGDAYYAHLLHDLTSTNLTADEINQIGMREVKRLTEEILEAGRNAGYPESASVGEIRARAARDAGFFNGASEDGEAEILAYYDTIFSTVETKMEPIFDLAPAADFVIVPEPIGGGGFYVSASVDGSRPGAFHAGTGGQISRYIVPTIAFHEAVPGHHYQIALAQELELPSFRRFEHYNGYVEGWALYAERLAYDLGMYADDPYGNIGRLELELLRAVRLVTDTGIHALGWTRDEARLYMITAIGDESWVHEVDRYVVLPAQATGYMIGQIEILNLRDEASTALGDAFDLADFHNAVIGNGSLPLDILDDVVTRQLGLNG